MAQVDRKFGSDVETFTLGGTNYLPTLQSGSVAFDLEKKQSKALKDSWGWPKAGVKNCKLDITLTVEATAPIIALFGTEVAVVLDTGPVTYSFQGLVGPPTHDISDGAQTIKVSLDSQGAVTVS